MATQKKTENHTTLTPAVFYILLTLCEGERHGYDIMQQVNVDSGGRIPMGPGTLYGSIDRMIEAGLVAESRKSTDKRRIYYAITDYGWSILGAEIKRLKDAVNLAQKIKIRFA